MTDIRRHVFPMLALIIILGAMLQCGYWWFFPEQVVVVKNCRALKVNKKVYAPGDRIIYLLDYCKTREIQGTVARAIVNGTVIPYVTIDSVLPVGCRMVLVGDLRIPEFMPSGIHHISGAGEYQVNPLRKAGNSWRTEDFMVINPLSPPALEDLQGELKKNTDDIEKHHEEDKAWQKKHER